MFGSGTRPVTTCPYRYCQRLQWSYLKTGGLISLASYEGLAGFDNDGVRSLAIYRFNFALMTHFVTPGRFKSEIMP